MKEDLMDSPDRSASGSGAAMEEISRDECLEMMARQPIGRVAVADPDAAPMVVPVNFFVDGDAVVFRTDPGTKFSLAVLDGRPVSFQVDGVDAGRHGGWSVLVQGRASEIDEPDGEKLALRPWGPGAKSHWVRIVPEVVAGRRIHPVPGVRWSWMS